MRRLLSDFTDHEFLEELKRRKIGRVVIIVRGGVVQEVLSDIPSIEPEVIDYDELECLEEEPDKAFPDMKESGLKTVY